LCRCSKRCRTACKARVQQEKLGRPAGLLSSFAGRAAGITLIALVSDSPGTKELKQLSLAIDTPDGIVRVVGCSHPGIEAIVAEAAKTKWTPSPPATAPANRPSPPC
jgi:hypothetical protein